MSAPVAPTRDIFESGSRGVRHRGLRRANEKAVLTVVGFNAGVSNAEISRISGLAPQTVSAILVDLERAGLIERGPVLRGRRGQPATPIQLDKNGAFAIGVELSWTHADAILLNMHAEVLAQRHLDYAYPDARTMVETISAMVRELTAALTPGQRERLQDLGIAMPGRLDENLDLVDAPTEQSSLWRNLDLAGELAARTGLEVSVVNDGNAACWAELIALERPRPANVLYFLVSRYVAAGIVGDGVLWEGPTGNGANLGSMLVQIDDGRPSEAHFIASLDAIEAMKQRGEFDLDTWIRQSARALARVTFNAMTVIESPLLVVDTVLEKSVTEQLARQIEIELAELPVRSFKAPKVAAGVHGRLAPAIGAAELTLYRRYF